MKSFVKKLALSLGFSLAAGLAFVPVGCGSSGGALGPVAAQHRDGEVPDRIALRLRTCAAEHMVYQRSGEISVSFAVELSNDGEVDSVALLESTLRDESLEGCMAGALRSLSERDLPSGRSGDRPFGSVSAESRAILGQTQALGCLASPPCVLALAFFIGAAYLVVQVYVHAAQSSAAKPKPRPATTATVEPVATTVPTAIPISRKDACTEMFAVCQAKAGRCTRVNTWGYTVCRECQVDCLARKAYGTSECYRCGFE